MFDLVVAASDDRADGRQRVVAHVDEAHALRRAADHGDFARVGANDLAARREEHDVVLVRHERGRHDATVALRGGDRNDPLTAAALSAVFGHAGALPVAVFGRRQHELRFVVDDGKRHDALAFLQTHAAHASGGAAHRAHVAFREAHRLARIREEHDVVRAAP